MTDRHVCGRDNRLRWFRPTAEAPAGGAANASPVRLALLGPPGVGKGTQAELLCQRYRACHLATGDLFRAASEDEHPTPAMAEALDAARRGGLVSDETVTRLIRERSACVACGGGLLLDGAPRTVSQAEALSALLSELGLTLDGVVLFELGEDVITARLGGRRTCPRCKAVYHLTARPPERPGACDRCGDGLVQREDDRPDVIRTRFAAYRAATDPLRDHYERRGELIVVDADGAPEEVFARAAEAIDRRRAARRQR